jgi:hypothetical protein
MTDPNAAPENSAPAAPVQHTAPPQPAPAYYAPAYAVPVYAAPPAPKGMSIASMVLGLVSIAFGFTFVLPVVGLVLGIIGLRREPTGRGMALTGVIVSSLILLVWVIIIVAIVIGSVVAAGSAVTYNPGN